MPAMEAHLLWIVSRAAGTAALLLSSAAVAVGLSMGGRLVKGRGVDLRAAHEALSLAIWGAAGMLVAVRRLRVVGGRSRLIPSFR